MVLVRKDGLDVAPDRDEEQGHAQAVGDQVEQGWLRVGEKSETMTKKDAMMFPVIASGE